jgi:hypothetical protein
MPTITIVNGIFNGTLTYEEQPPINPPDPDNEAGLITEFSGANDARIEIDGHGYYTQNADREWSLTNPDEYSLRFEVRGGDHNRQDSNDVNRSEIERQSPYWTHGTLISIAYGFTLEESPANKADWMIIGQIHGHQIANPPFAVAMYGEHMNIILRDPSSTEIRAYSDPQPIVRNRKYAMEIAAQFGNNAGTVKVWRDGEKIVDYDGALGGDSSDTNYFKCGIYRAATNQTIAAVYSNIDIA